MDRFWAPELAKQACSWAVNIGDWRCRLLRRMSPLVALKRTSLADINCFTSPAPSTVRLRRSLPPQAVRGLSAVQSLSDFADRQECAGSRLFDFQPLFVVSLNEADDSVQYRQRYLRWLALGFLQGFHYFCRFLAIANGVGLPVNQARGDGFLARVSCGC